MLSNRKFRVRGKTIGDLSPENSEDSDDAVNLIRRKRAVQNPRKSTQVLTSDRRSELHDGNHSDTSVTESILTAKKCKMWLSSLEIKYKLSLVQKLITCITSLVAVSKGPTILFILPSATFQVGNIYPRVSPTFRWEPKASTDLSDRQEGSNFPPSKTFKHLIF